MWCLMLGLALVVPEASSSHSCRGRIIRPAHRHVRVLGVRPCCCVPVGRQAPAMWGSAARAAPARPVATRPLVTAAHAESEHPANDHAVHASDTATPTPTPTPTPDEVRASHPVASELPAEAEGESIPNTPAPGARTGRLPRYFAQLELTDEQRQQVLTIQERYTAQEAELERQLSTLTAERDEQLRDVLTRSQQRKLRQLEGERGT